MKSMHTLNQSHIQTSSFLFSFSPLYVTSISWFSKLSISKFDGSKAFTLWFHKEASKDAKLRQEIKHEIGTVSTTALEAYLSFIAIGECPSERFRRCFIFLFILTSSVHRFSNARAETRLSCFNLFMISSGRDP